MPPLVPCRALRFLLVLSLLLLCATATAQPARGDAVVRALKIHKEGLRLYSTGQVARALKQFLAAQAISDDRHHLYYISRCHKDLDQLRQAHAAYRRYVRHLPAEKRPAELAVADQKLRLEPRSMVSISSQPAGATVVVDGKERGKTAAGGALVLKLPGGKPRIEVRLEGHRTEVWTPVLEYGEPQKKAFALRSQPATLKVRSAVAGTRVWLMGNAVGRAPLRLKMPPGRYLVQAKAAGHQVYNRWVNLAPGEAQTLRLELVARAPDAANLFFLDVSLGPSFLTYQDELVPAGWSYELSAGGGYIWRIGRWGWYTRGSLHYMPARDLADGSSSGAHVMGLVGGGARLYPRPWLWLDASASLGLSVLVGVSEQCMLFAKEPSSPGDDDLLPSEHKGAGYESLAFSARLGVGLALGPGLPLGLHPLSLQLIRSNPHFERGGSVFLSYNVAVALGWQR